MWKNRESNMSKLIAYAVSLQGVALASYPLAAEEIAAAEEEARVLLEKHRIIEVWSTDHRRVARLTRKAE